MVNKRKQKKSCRGAVSMEYVILGVLIAVAIVIAVIVFSRAVGGGFITASRGSTGDHGTAAEKHHQQQEDRNTDAERAREYGESLSK